MTRELSSDQTHWYRIALPANHYSRLTITASGIDVRATLSDAEGQMLVQTACHQNGPGHLSWIADRPGAYRLEIKACEMEPATGSYQVRIEEKRPATARDRQRVAADSAILQADKLRAENSGAANRRAVQEYTESLRLWRAIKDQAGESETLRKIGEVLYENGERQSALRHFNQALAISHRINDPQREIRILNNICSLRTDTGDYQEALAICSRALELSRAHKISEDEAQALSSFGLIYYQLSELRKSLDYQQAALHIWQGLRNRRGQALALLRIGYVRVILGETQEALAVQQRALSLFRSTNEYRGQALVLTALGHLYSSTGGKQEALNYYNQALPLSQQLEAAEIKAQLCSGMGYVYYQLGEFEKALSYRKQALELYHNMPDGWGECSLHLSVGRVYHAMGAEQQAIEHYQQGLTIARSLPNAHLESALLREMGAVYERLGQQQRQKALALYQQSLSLSRVGGDTRDEADALNHIGRLYESLGRKQEALDYFKQALPLTRAVNDRFAESTTLFNIAHVLRNLDRLDEARREIEADIHLVESLRIKVASQGLRATYLASVHQYYELYIDICMRIHKQRPGDGLDAVAFEASERARARSMLESLTETQANIRQGVDPALLERERNLQQALDVKAERQMRLLSGRHTEEEAAVVAREIGEITTEYDEVSAQIKVVSPRYADLMQPQPLNLKELQQRVLDDETLLLEYALGEEQSYLWAVTRTDIYGYELPGRAEIEEAARRVSDLVKAHQPVPGETFAQRQLRSAEADAQYWQEAAVLGRMILGPVAGQLGNKRLLIVADGALQYIPFGALMVPEAGPQSDTQAQANEAERVRDPVPLIVDHEIVSLPSASTLAVLRKETIERVPAPKGVAVLADPVFEKDDPRIPAPFREQAHASAEQVEGTEETEVGEVAALHRAVRDAGGLGDGGSIPRLLASHEEAEAIMQVTSSGAGLKATGFDASRALATSPELGQYRIVHFATHGLLNSEHPELSGVILSLVNQQGQPVNGFLRLHDIYNLNLPADLVVLSACNTGLGKEVKGEGLIGLTRGFMYAGASGVMASLWKVDDEATAELMKHFYSGMLKDGLPPAAALRQAQVMMWKQKRWRSPYYWAAFVLQGEYRERIDMGDHTQASTRKIVAVGLIVLVFSIGGGFYARKRRRRNAMQTGAL